MPLLTLNTQAMQLEWLRDLGYTTCEVCAVHNVHNWIYNLRDVCCTQCTRLHIQPAQCKVCVHKSPDIEEPCGHYTTSSLYTQAYKCYTSKIAKILSVLLTTSKGEGQGYFRAVE